jgi:outer membrane protein
MIRTLFLCLCLLCSVLPCSASATDHQIKGFVAVGAFTGPDYEGSKDFAVRPALAARLQYQHYRLQTVGLGATLNLSPLRFFQFGPYLNYRFGRDDVGNNVVSRLRSIDPSIEGGGFVSLAAPGPLAGSDIVSLEVRVLTDLTGVYDGTLVTFGPKYTIPFSERLRLSVGVNATYASDAYMQTYFGVDAENSARSGLQEFAAKEGVKNFSGSLTANYQLTEIWGLTGMVGYSRLRGDAAEAPIVTEEGSIHQFRALAALSCSF